VSEVDFSVKVRSVKTRTIKIVKAKRVRVQAKVITDEIEY